MIPADNISHFLAPLRLRSASREELSAPAMPPARLPATPRELAIARESTCARSSSPGVTAFAQHCGNVAQFAASGTCDGLGAAVDCGAPAEAQKQPPPARALGDVVEQ